MILRTDVFKFWDKQVQLYPELRDWHFQFNKRLKSTLGRTFYTHKLIDVAEFLLDHDEIFDTVLHEIAHALAFERFGNTYDTHKNDGHGPNWIKMCELVGAKPERYCTNAYAIPKEKMAKMKYRTVCKVCGDEHLHQKDILPCKILLKKCKCGSETKLVYTKDGNDWIFVKEKNRTKDKLEFHKLTMAQYKDLKMNGLIK